jgi:hypothetical protein
VTPEDPLFEPGPEIGIATGWYLQDDEPEESNQEPAREPLAAPGAKAGAAADTDSDADASVDADTSWLTDPDWLPGEADPGKQRAGWPLVAGVALLGIALAGQLAHRFRDTLADAPIAGSMLRTTYAIFGRELSPRVDLNQYDTLDLTAVAQPVTDEQGWLIIETRIHNKGPKVQPFPYIFVSLVDRWEETIAGRYFGPDEYTVTPAPDYSRMNIGSTIDAQFIIVDPGPGATGFELEFCTPLGSGFNCESDNVFD